jgi:hypothetical protein
MVELPMLPAIFAALLLSMAAQDAPQSADSAAAAESPRKAWLEMIGNWRVTGQPKRGSNAGAWLARGRIGWPKVLKDEGTKLFEGKPRSLAIVLPESRIWKEAGVVFEPGSDQIAGLLIVDQESKSEKFYKHLDSSDTSRYIFEFTPDKGSSQPSERLTFQRRTADRWTILAESRKPESTTWARVVDIGMTREGTTIALGDGQKKCVVTGGLGDIEVTVNGKTVFVCCSGCKEALLDDPDSFLKPATPAAPADTKKAVKP